MIEVITYLLMIALAVVAIVRKSPALLYFISACVVMSIINTVTQASNFWFYYCACILINELVIEGLARFEKITKRTTEVQIACFGFILLNTFGLITFIYYIPSIWYSIACIALFAVLLFISVTRKGALRRGYNTVISYFGSNCRFVNTSLLQNKTHKRARTT